MKAIMISIRPEWVEKIIKGEKTIELRKSYPKCELPCKVYIYCTKGRILWMHNKETIILGNTNLTSYLLNGEVVAEFTLNAVDEFKVFENGTVQYWNYHDLEKSCLTYDEISNYVGRNKIGYAWHIDNLKIYNRPKELSEFKVRKYLYKYTHDCWDTAPLKRPPQSWCYVEEI